MKVIDGMKDYICPNMCGILGSYIPGKAGVEREARFRSALDLLSRRGPDAEGVYSSQDVLLGHKRLSVIDLGEGARQPFSDPSGRYTICYNGEIFNYAELREQLQKKGVSFRTSSDTEVLLYAFLEYGHECLNRLNGFFAFAIYDSVKQALFIARDRFGVKPLYFASGPDGFHFSSTSKPIRSLSGNSEIDLASLALFLQLNYIPEPYSIYKEVRRLPAGHYLELMLSGPPPQTSKLESKAWYALQYPPKSGKYNSSSYPEVCHLLREALSKAVERRLVSDVPLGSFLSGGVDSSIIAALAAQKTNALETFSIGFGKDPRYDESPFAEEVAKHIGSRHHTFQLTEQDLLDTLPGFLESMDEPFADSSSLAVYVLSRETRKNVTVALSGDGSDELFAGYQKHRAEYLIRGISGTAGRMIQLGSTLLKPVKGSRSSAWGNRIRQLHRFAEGIDSNPIDRYWKWCGWSTREDAIDIMKVNDQPELITELEKRKQHLLAPLLKNPEDFNAVLQNDVQLVLPGDMLTKVDRMSMEHALEVRTPFLDFEVVELAFQMPADFKIQPGSQKKILRDTFQYLLPESVFSRKKMGFEIPVERWLPGTIQPMLLDLLRTHSSEASRIFDVSHIEKMTKQDFRGVSNGPARAWGLLIALYWLQNDTP